MSHLQVSVVNPLAMAVRDCIYELLKIFPRFILRESSLMNLFKIRRFYAIHKHKVLFGFCKIQEECLMTARVKNVLQFYQIILHQKQTQE